MAFQTLLVDHLNGVVALTINRPEKLNALNQTVMAELALALAAAEDDPAVRVIVITGAGNKAFVAGADINELAELNAIDALTFGQRGQALMMRIERCSKPVIAAVNGFALGGGFELALACSLRIAAEHAQFGLPEINLGIMPGYGGTQRLTRLAGAGRALAMALSGDRVSATEAQQFGVVNQVVPATELLAQTQRYAENLASKAPLAARAILDAVQRAAQYPTDQGCNHEAHAFALLCASADKNEGTRAFLEKRPAQFSGR